MRRKNRFVIVTAGRAVTHRVIEGRVGNMPDRGKITTVAFSQPVKSRSVKHKDIAWTVGKAITTTAGYAVGEDEARVDLRVGDGSAGECTDSYED